MIGTAAHPLKSDTGHMCERCAVEAIMTTFSDATVLGDPRRSGGERSGARHVAGRVP
jgi:hypothetical protein